ncbi:MULTISPECIES: hypothetical protein [unclassified Brevundimonas]|uniref:hypothetical protein n=1 Tax=unclassified Brevundimonas TaxID=2622653 RepID=UPI0025BA3067|nr:MULTISPECIES: hypothetical protein [unclassified Brevundimonas]
MISSLVWTLTSLFLPDVSAQPTFLDQARLACSAAPGSHVIDGIHIEPRPAAPGDLPGLTVRDEVSGAWMTVFHDAPSATAAARFAPCLGAQLRLLHYKTADVRSEARWASVAFTTDAAYQPPRDGSETRWTIVTTAHGAVDDAALTRLNVTIPHEQVHAFQKHAGAVTPRWFHEGHAEWVGRQVTRALSPTHADQHAADGEDSLARSTVAVALDRWGGVAVKREALLRQLSPEDRRRAEHDPSFVPPGPFSFGPDDLESDESNAPARYQAAWRQFETLAREVGDAPVRDWVKAITETSGRVANTDVDQAAVVHLGRQLTERP